MTKTRQSKIEANETRLKIFHLRQDNIQSFVQDRDETESLGTFSIKTETLANQCLRDVMRNFWRDI